MSTARSCLASSCSLTNSLTQLIYGGSRPSPKAALPWICRQCRLKIDTRRTFAGLSLTKTRRLGDEKTRRHPIKQSRRPITDERRKDQRHDENASQTELPSHEEQRRSTMTKRFSSIMDNLQANIFFAGQRLNDLTGYSGIEKLKKEIEEQEQDLRAAQDQLTAAKSGYTAAIQQRSDSQREVNELLQRKNSWSPQDLERFTSLYRTEHAHEQAEIEAQQRLNDAERFSEEASAKLSSKILRRYHEEQIWSDKIRRMSTWGTWGLMGVNVLLFLVFQIGVEPWRRKRLVKGFEEKVIEALETQKQHANKVTGEALAALQATHIASSTESSAAVFEVEEIADEVVTEDVVAEVGADVEEVRVTPSLTSFEAWLPGLRSWQDRLESSFGEQEVLVRQVDLTKKLLEGAFVGVMLTSIIATIIRGR